MAAQVQPLEQANDLLQKLSLDTRIKTTENLETAPIHEGGGPLDSNGEIHSGVVNEPILNNGNNEAILDSGIYYAPNGYIPHGFVYDYSHAGYDSPVGDWEEYPRYVGVDGVEIHHAGFYGENVPVAFHQPGYGFSSQPTYGPYSPAAQMPTMGADGQLYGPAAFQYRGPIYQQSPPPGAPYFPQVIVSEGPAIGDTNPHSTDRSSPGLPPNGPRPSFPFSMMPPHGPYPRGVIPVSLPIPGPQDVRAGYEGFRPPNRPLWPEVPKSTEGLPRSGIPSIVHTVASQPIPGPGNPSQQFRPLPQMQVRMPAPQSLRPSRTSSPGLGPGSLGRGYPPLSRGIPNIPGIGRGGRGSGLNDLEFRGNVNGRTWINGDKTRLRERPFELLTNGFANGNGNSNGHMDVLCEQNRGPRISRIRNQRMTPTSVNGKDQNDDVSTFSKEQYNGSDFNTSYTDAKYFVIKSYSEDDVHKSIKYHVWASTPNGNKRLDVAYQGAQAKITGKQETCPIFLFFSVNASGQFCGLAEMTGPVDFTKSVEYWQQDKWSGQFSVKWHIIKDIPNSQFRHIILQNNDNKPVTNSRDTQEIKFEQGNEMLNIFKNYPSKTSILDDFQFYDNRQKAMQDKKSRLQAQQQLQQQVRAGELYEQRTFEVPSMPKIEKENDGTMIKNVVSGASPNCTATGGKDFYPPTGAADRSVVKSREELSPESDQKEVVEAAFQRKSYLRSLKEGKAENVTPINVPKNPETKTTLDDKKGQVRAGTEVETK